GLQGDPTATIACVTGNPFVSPADQLANSRQIVLQNLTINVNGTEPTGNPSGVMESICSNCNIRNVTVHTPRSGITFAYRQDSARTSTVNATGTGGAGIGISSSSDVALGGVQVLGAGVISGPGSTGILVDQGATGRLVPAAPASGASVTNFGTG